MSEAESTDIFTEKSFSTAERLLEYIAPWKQHWTPEHSANRRWLFRGQRDAKWPLLPSALRKRTQYPKRAQGVPNVLYEMESYREFVLAADRQGLALPFSVLSQLPLPEEQTAEWPEMNLIASLALAQHYGVETCLLDWTYSPYCAAYFASEPHPEGFGKETEAVIWALDHRCIQSILQRFSSVDLHTVQPPYSANPNLRRQEGVLTFLMHREASPQLDNRIPSHMALTEPLDEFLTKLAEDNDFTNSGYRYIVQRLVLPAAQKQDLRKALAEQGMDAAVLFDGYVGAARTVAELLRDRHCFRR